MNEFIGGITILWCAATYWLGGQEIPGLRRGFKWLRRFGLPLWLSVGLFVMSPSMGWRLPLACTLLCAALHLGYQAVWWKYVLTGFSFAIPTILLTSLNWTMFLPCFFHGLFGFASLRDNRFGWSFVALLTGASIGVCYVYAVSV